MEYVLLIRYDLDRAADPIPFCSGLVLETDSSGVISDHPQSVRSNYYDNTNCQWLIAPAAPVSRVSLTFLTFYTQPSADFL